MPDPITTALFAGLQADNGLRARVIRAEKAAHGAVCALQGYIEAASGWFKAAGENDHDGMVAALDRLMDAHNGALKWAREEAERVRSRI